MSHAGDAWRLSVTVGRDEPRHKFLAEGRVLSESRRAVDDSATVREWKLSASPSAASSTTASGPC